MTKHGLLIIGHGSRLEYGKELFTSARSFTDAVLLGREGKLLIAVGNMTAEAMRYKGVNPDVVGDGSLAGTLAALNRHLTHHSPSPAKISR